MCFVFIRKQRATCATYSINWLVFITEMKSVYSAVRTGPLTKAVCASSLKGYIILTLTVATLKRFQSFFQKSNVEFMCNSCQSNATIRREMSVSYRPELTLPRSGRGIFALFPSASTSGLWNWSCRQTSCCNIYKIYNIYDKFTVLSVAHQHLSKHSVVS